VVVVRDGAEALDYLYRRGKYEQREDRLGANAYVVKPVEFSRFVQAVRELRVFWAVINEAPPGSVRKGQ